MTTTTATTTTTAAAHPEEIECFRQPNGGFSLKKRYEYTYSTRRSLEYIPALCRQDFRHFTTKPFIYAGEWLRSEQRGFGDGGDYWEVFRADDGTENIVYWDYDGTMCWRECAAPAPADTDLMLVDLAIDDTATDTAVISEIIDEIIESVSNTTHQIDEIIESVSNTTHHVDETPPPPPPPPPAEWSLFECIFGQPSKCGMFDKAEITTMETKNCVHSNIAEFWCFVTSLFYGSSLLLYFVKEEDWFEKWREQAALPGFIHLSIICSVIVMICSMIYHSTLFEVTGCIDCFFASVVFVSVTMSAFGVGVVVQSLVLVLLSIVYIMMWRYSTRLAVIVVGIVFPFSMLSCYKAPLYYGVIVGLLLLLGMLCFILDRMGYAPLHSLWHIFGGCAIFATLYNVVVNGPLSSDNSAFSLVR